MIEYDNITRDLASGDDIQREDGIQRNYFSFVAVVHIKSSSSLSDYQVSVSKTTSDNVRFAQVGKINHWKESNTIRWVKVPTITGVSKVLMYYGNPSASSESNISSVWGEDISLFYTFEEGTGTTTYDKSGNGRDGTLNNGVSWSDGWYGGGTYYDGTDDYISEGTSNDLDPQEVSFSIWVKPDVNPSDITMGVKYIFAKQHDTTNYRDMNLFINGDGTFLFWFGNGSTNINCQSTTTWSKGNWYKIDVIRTTTQVRMFINGEEDANSPWSYSFTPTDNSDPLWIGFGYGDSSLARHFKGWIDHFIIWKRARDVSEIKYADPEPTVTIKTTRI